MLDGTLDTVEQFAATGGVWGDFIVYTKACYHPIELIAHYKDSPTARWREVQTKLRRRSAEHQASNS